jgi:MoaA/NifB/PqqE/SkfB family radical SAM enzyme/Tfp pilus assembly protein PilF
MDFCRSADNAGLSIGTWDINLTHNSGGTFGSKDWHAKYTKYLEKWESPNMDVVDIEVSEVELPDQPIIIATQYEEALNHQLEGREDEAERIYLDILAIEPNNSDVNHNLGFIEFNKVSAEHALPRFEAAVLAKPESEQYWVSYIDALMESGASETGFSAIEHGLKFGLGEESAKALREEYKQKLMPETIKAPVPQFVDGAIPGAWLQAYPKSLMIEYTSRCNLRCKYCPKSNPGEDQVPGRNMDMTNQTVDAVIELIEQHTYSELLLAGTGESTFHPNWMEDFPRIIQAGKNANPESYIHLNSNFAIKFENEHWDVLSQLDGIVISIDTSDRQLTKTVRAKSDLGLIIYNIIRFQTYCESRGLKLPQITVNVTLYQEAAAGLPELMVMLSKLPIKQVSISDMYEGKAATKNNIKAIHADDTTTFEQVIANIEKAKQLAQSLGVFTLFIQPQLIERINKMQLANQVAVDVENVSVTKGRNTTKLCLQPWTRFTLAADAAIFPCCVTDMSPVGRIDTKLEQDGLNGEKIKTFRKDLLNGNVPSICVNCTNAQSCSTNELKQAVQNLSIQHAPKVVAELVPKPETFNQENKPESEALTQVINEVLQQAIEHQVAQRFDEAKVLYDEVLAINSMQPVANLALGIMQVNQNPNNVDLKYFENAINADLDNEQNWTTYIDVLILMGDFERAQNVITVGQNHGLTQQSAQALELAIEAGLQNTLSNIDDTTTDQNIAQFLKQVLIQINREIGSQPLDSSKANSITYKKEFTPFIDVSVFKKTMTGLFEKGDVNAALVVIYKSVVSLKGKNELVGHKIFTPYFDEVLENIDLDISDVVARSGKNVNLVIASELYDFGGHTPVINEILGSVENPMLVVTDLYNRFAKNDGFAAVASTMVNCPVLIMPNESFINKTIRLAQTINSVAKNVFLLSHHDDVIATTACQKNFETDYYFIHHADHNPALGNCTKHFKHVDLFESRVKMCSEDLNTNALYLPTTAKDQGLKTFNYAENTQFSTVSGGSYGKFFNDGGVLYMSAVTASLKTTGGKHYHFGDLPDAQILKIRAHLVANGVDQQNFVYVGNVPSLWKALLDIDAHIFMGSLPVMGAKSDIEAQGAGYPLVAYQDPLGPKYLNKGSHESKTVYWSTVDGLEKGLNTVMGNHQALSKAARAYYLSQCNPQQFDSAIKELSQ